jgi:hypothetical protein
MSDPRHLPRSIAQCAPRGGDGFGVARPISLGRHSAQEVVGVTIELRLLPPAANARALAEKMEVHCHRFALLRLDRLPRKLVVGAFVFLR